MRQNDGMIFTKVVEYQNYYHEHFDSTLNFMNVC
jgi:hypothetical protein